MPKKPDPAGVYLIMKELGVTSENACILGILAPICRLEKMPAWIRQVCCGDSGREKNWSVFLPNI